MRMKIEDLDGDEDTTSDEVVQNQLTKISILKAEMFRLVHTSDNIGAAEVGNFMSTFEQWSAKVPDFMKLERILASPLDTNLRNTVCFVHLLYLGAKAFLARRLMFNIGQVASGNKTKSSEPIENAYQYIEEGFMATRRSAGILELLLQDGGVFRRSWLCMSVPQCQRRRTFY